MKNGYGTQTTTRGDTYKGEWLNGKMHGSGKFINGENGDYYIGDWVNGKRHGNGSYYSSNEELLFSGNWINGVPVEN